MTKIYDQNRIYNIANTGTPKSNQIGWSLEEPTHKPNLIISGNVSENAVFANNKFEFTIENGSKIYAITIKNKTNKKIHIKFINGGLEFDVNAGAEVRKDVAGVVGYEYLDTQLTILDVTVKGGNFESINGLVY